MERLRRAARRLLWPSVVGIFIALATMAALFAAGHPDAAYVAAGSGAILAMPALAAAAVRPRAGLVWEGRYAEPWRAERSPGEPSVVDRNRAGPKSGNG